MAKTYTKEEIRQINIKAFDRGYAMGKQDAGKINWNKVGKIIETVGMSLFALLVCSCIVGAFAVAFCMIFEILFKVKLI